jgi:hypothetical protein
MSFLDFLVNRLNFIFSRELSLKMAGNVCGLLLPGHAPRGLCRRKLVNFNLKPIYGGTGTKASILLELWPGLHQAGVVRTRA